MKRIIFFILLISFIFIGSSFADSFSTEDLSGKGKSVIKVKDSDNTGYDYDDYMGTSAASQAQSRRVSYKERKSEEPMPYHFEFEADVSTSAVEGRLSAFIPLNMNSLGTAVGIIYDKDTFSIGNADLTIGNRQSDDNFLFDIGFRGIIGTVEKTDSISHGDFKGLGFMGSVIYKIRGSELAYQIPLNFEIAGELSFVPKTLCFGDAEQYMGIQLSLGLDIFGDGRGFIFIGGRYIDIRMSKDSESWDGSGGSAFLGFKIRF